MNNKFEKINNCPYCMSVGLEPLFTAKNWFGKTEEKYYLSRCESCGLVFQNPRIREGDIEGYYTDDLGYYHPSLVKKSDWTTHLKVYLNKQILINYFDYNNLGRKNILIKLILSPFRRKIYINLTPNHIIGGKLLEIGCSHGANLKKMNEIGWDVVGLEMNEKSANYARSMGLRVFTDKIENINFPSNNFDVIVMGMVLEHLYHPFNTLKIITNWLKPGGQLIFSIPYFDGWEYGVFKEYTYGLHLPHHLSFLNKKILIEYLTKLGYRNIRFHFHYFDRDVIASAGYKYSATKLYRYKFLSENKVFRLLVVKPLLYILSFFGKTGRVTVYAKRTIIQ